MGGGCSQLLLARRCRIFRCIAQRRDIGCAASAGMSTIGKACSSATASTWSMVSTKCTSSLRCEGFQDLGHVLFIVLGQNDFEQAGAMRGE